MKFKISAVRKLQFLEDHGAVSLKRLRGKLAPKGIYFVLGNKLLSFVKQHLDFIPRFLENNVNSPSTNCFKGYAIYFVMQYVPKNCFSQMDMFRICGVCRSLLFL